MKWTRASVACFALSLVAACSAPPVIDDGGSGGDANAGLDGALNTMDSGLGDGTNGGSEGGSESGAGADGSNPGVDGATGPLDGTAGPDGGTGACRPVACGGRLLECGDCVDNDGDGRIDERDPECLGPCDNTEGPVLLAGVGGEAGGPCRSDCYFDFGNGSGNDDCEWDHRCDPLAVAPNYPPEGMSCAYESSRVGSRTCPATQSTQCLNFCQPITPNGCDCFGCCTFPQIAGRPAAMGGEWVWLGSRNAAGAGSCTLADVRDTSRCLSCTPVRQCLNECGPCEVCVGRPMPPPECFPPPPVGDGGTSGGDGAVRDSSVPTSEGGVPATQCPAGIQPCGLPGQSNCPANFYCTTGCCIPIPG
ncbi:MAG: hypothetical protein Q8Q09_18525 [Deltaproteobacteria bacterium]|nr:hypothetical protein [Deltaproteobacteria bacterium]